MCYSGGSRGVVSVPVGTPPVRVGTDANQTFALAMRRMNARTETTGYWGYWELEEGDFRRGIKYLGSVRETKLYDDEVRGRDERNAGTKLRG